MGNEEYTQLSIFDLVDINVENGQSKWTDGTIVLNTCNNKKYTVKHDDGDIVEVFDNERGYLIMAKTDLKLLGNQ